MPSMKAGRARPGGVATSAAMEASVKSSSAPLISTRTAPEVMISRAAEDSVLTISRTAEVLYMLSHGAQLEHPHMINVHYAARQPGPTLRDVKVRLVALRGKGMPDSFSWSYKRKYRNTFIWCDLFDDDLIVPIPGSEEYVLKAVKLFDVKPVAASKDDKAVATVDPELELPLVKSPRRSASPWRPRPSSRLLASQPEHRHVEDDVSQGIKKSLLLINIPPSPAAADITPKLLMSNLKGGGAATEACTFDHNDDTTESHVRNAASQTAISKRDETRSVSPPRMRRREVEEEETTTSGPDDPFLYGVLRKATKLGSSFRPRLCRGVDVIESTRIKTKLYYRSKADKSSPVEPTSPPPREEEAKPLQGFASLKEYFESKNLSPTPEPEPRKAFGNEALDASYRKTMEVLAKLPNSRRVHHTSCGDDNKQQQQQQQQQQEKEMMFMSLQNSKLHDPHDEFLSRFCSIHGLEDGDDDDHHVPVRTGVETRDRDIKPRSRSVMKRATMASFEASTVSRRAKATVKTAPGDERRVKGAARNSVTKVEDECSEMDSRGVHNGNKQGGLKPSVAPAATSSLGDEGGARAARAAPAAGDDAEAVSEGAKRWPLEPSARPRDFKSREDRPLIPGLTTTDWEKSLQEACLLSEPPANLVLHECLQCGRTFKPESLQVHMRGCRGSNYKPKQRRA